MSSPLKLCWGAVASPITWLRQSVINFLRDSNSFREMVASCFGGTARLRKFRPLEAHLERGGDRKEWGREEQEGWEGWLSGQFKQYALQVGSPTSPPFLTPIPWLYSCSFITLLQHKLHPELRVAKDHLPQLTVGHLLSNQMEHLTDILQSRESLLTLFPSLCLPPSLLLWVLSLPSLSLLSPHSPNSVMSYQSSTPTFLPSPPTFPFYLPLLPSLSLDSHQNRGWSRHALCPDMASSSHHNMLYVLFWGVLAFGQLPPSDVWPSYMLPPGIEWEQSTG